MEPTNSTPAAPELTTPAAPVTPPATEQAAAPVTPQAPAAPPTQAPALQMPDDTPAEIKEYALKSGMNQVQFEGAVKTFMEHNAKQAAAASAAQYEQGKAHIASWGENAKHNLSLAKRALQITDPQGKLAAKLKATGAANDPVVLDFLRDVGKMLQEGGFITSAKTLPPGQKSLAEKMYGGTHTA